MIRFFSVAMTLCVAMFSLGCSSDGDERREEYLDADYYTRLELPPDLTAPEDSKQLSAPRPSEEAIEQFRRDSEKVGIETTEKVDVVKTPVALQASSARLQSAGGVFWLEVDESVDKVWPQLSGFWSHEGIRIVRNEPMLGVLETDWVSKLQVDEDAGFLTRMFNQVEPDKLDKFRLRVEPGERDTTRIFLSHSGLEVAVEGDDINWRTRCSEEELEREMLNRLALYVGLDEQQAEQAFENYRPYASRVKLPQDELHVIYVTGSMNFVWKRTLRALDRLGAEIDEMDGSRHRISVAIGRISREQLGQERDEIAESSWMMQWLTETGEEGRRFALALQQQNGVVRTEIQDTDGEPAQGVLAEQFRKQLAIELQ